MKQTWIYLAGPLFSEQDRELLVRISSLMEEAGLMCFVPHREVGDLSEIAKEHTEEIARQFVFESDIGGLKDCTLVCALLDGPDVDSGTAGEMGIAYATGKPVLGLCTDLKRRRKTINNVIWGFCTNGTRIYETVEDMVAAALQIASGSMQRP